MIYIRVEWKHELDDEPTMLYSELDADRWEVRKVELYRDGSYGWADRSFAAGGTRLGDATVPNLTEINLDPQFAASEITAAEFEEAWEGRRVHHLRVDPDRPGR
jgi:hypothetical protein